MGGFSASGVDLALVSRYFAGLVGNSGRMTLSTDAEAELARIFTLPNIVMGVGIIGMLMFALITNLAASKCEWDQPLVFLPFGTAVLAGISTVFGVLSSRWDGRIRLVLAVAVLAIGVGLVWFAAPNPITCIYFPGFGEPRP